MHAMPWIVLIAALSIRGLGLFAAGESLADDPDAYARLAVNLAETGVLGFENSDRQVRPTAFRPPLYPWLLSWLVVDGQLSPRSVALLHWLLGVATVWLTYRLAKQLRVEPVWLPPLAVAVDPLLLRASQLVMTETLATFLAVLVWQLWLLSIPARRVASESATVGRTGWKSGLWPKMLGPVALGLLLGLSILARPTAAPWALSLALAAAWPAAGCRWPYGLMRAALVCMATAACLLPWVGRNYLHFAMPIWGTTHGGYTLLLANNPPLYEHFRQSGPDRGWEAEPFHQAWARRHQRRLDPRELEFWQPPPVAQGEADVAVATSELGPSGPGGGNVEQHWSGELADDRLAYAAAQATIARDPRMFVKSSFYRVGWLWAVWPHGASRTEAALVGGWYAGWFIAAVGGLAWVLHRRGVWPWLPPLLLVATLTLVHAFYWSNMRMRTPAMPAVYLFAGLLLGRIVGLRRSPQGKCFKSPSRRE